LRRLGQSGVISYAARAAGVSVSMIRRCRIKDARFNAAVDDALEKACDCLELVAHRRAAIGTLKPVYQNGKKVGVVREHSDTLLIFLLKANRPEKYRESFALQQLVEQLALAQAQQSAPARAERRRARRSAGPDVSANGS